MKMPEGSSCLCSLQRKDRCRLPALSGDRPSVVPCSTLTAWLVWSVLLLRKRGVHWQENWKQIIPGNYSAVWVLVIPGMMATVAQKHFLEGQTYSVPLIQPDLRREEAVQQVADALQYLQKVSGDIFNRIGSIRLPIYQIREILVE
ncbi:hypothetical protein llap_16510 [Limosa lapponica baueri]|uniref:WASH1 WAHD domain-containing protein n=1 Tax=Limosa lapponica baueri TaxID=1758121 RepID=A0A2I0THE0_LIMLA|nr:hypothetical protein llap_16510 [Limosa lapponica baueri]